MKAHDIVEVDWTDAVGKHGWSDSLATLSPRTKSVGYLVRDDDEVIVLVESIDEDPESTRPYGCSTAIPRSMVKKIRQIRKARK